VAACACGSARSLNTACVCLLTTVINKAIAVGDQITYSSMGIEWKLYTVTQTHETPSSGGGGNSDSASDSKYEASTFDITPTGWSGAAITGVKVSCRSKHWRRTNTFKEITEGSLFVDAFTNKGLKQPQLRPYHSLNRIGFLRGANCPGTFSGLWGLTGRGATSRNPAG
jgi:hypothetical protein